MEELFFVWSFASYYFYEIVTIFFSSLALKKLWNRVFHGYNLPPGPWGLPFVGYFPFVSDLPHFTFNKLAEKYGPVFGLNIGFRYCVVLNDFESVKEAYQKEALSGRTPGTFKLPSNSENFSEQSGEMWREHKKLFLAFTRAIAKPKQSGRSLLEDVIVREVERFVSNIEKSPNTPINVRENLVDFMYKVVFGYMLGTDISVDNPIIMKNLTDQYTPLLYTGTVKALGQSFPQLSFITKWWEPIGTEYTKFTMQTEAVLRKQVEQHKLNLKIEEPKDYIDFFLIQQKENPSSPLYTDGMLLGNLQSFILGGSHTVRSTLEWLFVLLAEYQDVQEQIYQEIKAEVGTSEIPRWEIRNCLTYTHATILESIRLFTLAPVNTPRWALEDTTIRGFDIPKGTVVYSNNWLVNHEPSYWKDPLEFVPERFIDEEDPKKLRSSERVISFSYGRRECPGKQQAMMEVFLLLTRTLQKFHVLPVEGIQSLGPIQKTMISMPCNPTVLFKNRV